MRRRRHGPGDDRGATELTRILFVCLGNICRSPTAEAVMRKVVEVSGFQNEVEVDSAGTGGWHVGSPPDARSRDAAARRGFELTGAARQITIDDFEEFDLILAADHEVLDTLLQAAPLGTEDKVRLLLGDRDVPDPYYGGEEGFEEVLDLIEEACRELLDEVT